MYVIPTVFCLHSLSPCYTLCYQNKRGKKVPQYLRKDFRRHLIFFSHTNKPFICLELLESQHLKTFPNNFNDILTDKKFCLFFKYFRNLPQCEYYQLDTKDCKLMQISLPMATKQTLTSSFCPPALTTPVRGVSNSPLQLHIIFWYVRRGPLSSNVITCNAFHLKSDYL